MAPGRHVHAPTHLPMEVLPRVPLGLDFEEPLPRGFFARGTTQVARELLGKVIAHRGREDRVRAGMIMETEAYVEGDPANHAFRGLGRRNWTMFAGPAHLYVYRIHQVHCANVTTAPGEAVLVRAALPVQGTSQRMSGPGLLCRALQLERAHDGSDVTSGPVRFLPGFPGPLPHRTTERIGVSQGVKLLYRFVVPSGFTGAWRS